MSEQLKFIVQELNKEPLNKSYNLISFDSLEPIQLHQVLTDVLAVIDPKQKVDVREEAADQTALRLFTALRILKYKPPTDSSNLQAFRNGLVQGQKQVIYPILEWLLQKMPELKKRAYLARYLVKLDVSPDFLHDEDISVLNEQYLHLMDEFKHTHRDHDQLMNSGFNTADIKKDIASMEDERDQLAKRIERLKRKVEAQPNSGPMLKIASSLRQERDREQKLQQQKQEQKNTLVQMEQRIQRLYQQLKDTRQASIGATPEGLLQKLDEEVRTNTYMMKEQLPKEIASKKKMAQDLQRVVAEPAMGQSDLDAINAKIKATNAEINQLVEKRMMSGDPTDDKLSLFRQQAAIIVRKKEVAAENLRSLRDDLTQCEAEVDEKRQSVQASGGEEVLKGDEFKKYVNKLRSKSTVYKKKRQEIAELRAELGVLSRTEEILKQKDETVNKKLGKVESKAGVSGYRETQEALESVSALKSEMDQMKGRTLEDISHLVTKLNNKIGEKKANLAPIIKELRPLRQEAQELTQDYEQKKSQYDTTSAGLESNRSKLEQEVRGLREECSAEESRYHYLQAMQQILKGQQQRIDREMKAYTSSDPQEKKKAFREQYQKKIQEQENLGKALRERQKSVRENQDTDIKQMVMWRDMRRILEMKLGHTSGNSHAGSGGAGAGLAGYQPDPGDDRLVL